MEAKSREHCKIRKRGNSSSSSSSLVQKYRFKRAILVGKRGGVGGSTTPVPTWMTSSKSPTLNIPTTAAADQHQQTANKCSTAAPLSQSGGKDHVSVSARKLAATLWEINQIPSPRLNKKDSEEKKETMERSRGNSNRRRTSASARKKFQVINDYNVESVVNSACLMEIETHTKSKTSTECISGTKSRLNDVSNGLTTSKELLKVLCRIWGNDQHHSSGISLVSALRVEVDQARAQVDQMIKENRSNGKEIEHLMKHFEEERVAWKSKERDKIRNAIACIAEELEVERKLRKQTERLNKKLGKELADTKASLSKAMKELESEKRAKEIIEQVCDELARGIGEDRAEVEELKRESLKVKEEVEKEREMLQLADVLREERVQMKLSEAKYHFEEKNAAVESLRDELEAYLREKVGNEDGDGSPNHERIKELEAYLKEIQIGSYQKIDRGETEGKLADGEVHDGEDSAESDLHSIELNMDNNSWSYKWSFACDEDGKARKSISGSKKTSTQKLVSPPRQWGLSLPLEEESGSGSDDASGSSPMFKGDILNLSSIVETGGEHHRIVTSSRY